MASLTIKNIPDEVYDMLKRSATANHRSINGERVLPRFYGHFKEAS